MVERYFHVTIRGETIEIIQGKQGELEDILNKKEIKILMSSEIIPVVSVMADSSEKISYLKGLAEKGYKVEEYYSGSLNI